jgi:hypothetical protein
LAVLPAERLSSVAQHFVRGSRFLRPLVVAFAILSFLAFVTPTAHAQTAGEITGQVVDSSKAAIPNAAVTATDIATGAVRTAQTDDQGHYALTNLPVGTYSIAVAHEGFQQLKQMRVMLNVATTVTLNFMLTIGSVNRR